MEARRSVKHPVNSFLVSLCLTLSCTATALANPCARDIAALCPNVPAGGGRIVACLKTDAVALSSACRQRLEKLQAQLKGVHQACEDDIALFCTGVEPGEGRIARCLEANEAHLSQVCKRAMSGSRQEASTKK